MGQKTGTSNKEKKVMVKATRMAFTVACLHARNTWNYLTVLPWTPSRRRDNAAVRTQHNECRVCVPFEGGTHQNLNSGSLPMNGLNSSDPLVGKTGPSVSGSNCTRATTQVSKCRSGEGVHAERVEEGRCLKPRGLQPMHAPLSCDRRLEWTYLGGEEADEKIKDVDT